MIRISTVTVSAAPFPQVSSRTAEATEVEAMSPGSVMRCQSTTPSVPICSSRQIAMMPRIEKRMERGSVRPGSLIPAPM